jgi:hypothetical protein
VELGAAGAGVAPAETGCWPLSFETNIAPATIMPPISSATITSVGDVLPP